MTAAPGSSSHKLTQALTVSLLGIVVARAAGFVINTYMARRLGSDAYGNFIMLLALVQFGAMLLTAGFDAGAVRFIGLTAHRGREESLAYFWTILCALAFFCAGGTALFFAAGPRLIAFFNARELPWLLSWGSALVVFGVFANFFMQTLQAIHAFRPLIVVRDMLEPLLRLAGLCLGFLWGFRLAAATGSQLVGTAFLIASGFLLVAAHWPGGFGFARPSWPALKTAAAFSFPILLTQMAGYFLQWADTLTLGTILSARDVGVYGAAQRWAALAGIPMAALTPLFLPIITRLYGEGNLSEVTRLFKRTTDGLNIVAWVCLYVIFAYATPLMSLFGAEYVPIGRFVLKCLAVAGFIQLATGPGGSLFYMFGYSKIMFYNALGLVPVTLFLMYALVTGYGVIGAAAAVVLTSAISNAVNLIELWVLRRIHPFSANVLKITCIGGGLSTALFLASQFFPIHTYGIDILAWLTVYPAALAKFVLSREDIAYWKKFFKIAS